MARSPREPAPTTSARKAVPADPSELRLDSPSDIDDDIFETSGRPAVAPPPAEHQELTDDQVAVALSEEEHRFLGHHTKAGKRRVNPFALFLELFFLLLLVGGVAFIVLGMQTYLAVKKYEEYMLVKAERDSLVKDK